MRVPKYEIPMTYDELDAVLSAIEQYEAEFGWSIPLNVPRGLGREEYNRAFKAGQRFLQDLRKAQEVGKYAVQ